MKKIQMKNSNIIIILTLIIFMISISNKLEAASFGDYEYQLINEETEVEIIEYNGKGGDIIIPSEIDGKPVTSIKKGGLNYGVFYDRGINEVILPKTLINIGDYAFCRNQLTNIIFPQGLTSIGAEAFSNNQLARVIIPEGVTYMGVGAFSNNQLKDVIIPEGVTNIEAGIFFGNQLKDIIIPEGIISIGNYAFSENELTRVTIPEGVTFIGVEGFSNNRLTSVVIPESISDIGKNVFSWNQKNSEDFIIYGKAGSRAESYSNIFKHTFVSINISHVESIIINCEDNKTTIESHQGKLQILANVYPEDATYKDIIWSVEPITGQGEIDKFGVLTAKKNGVVRVIATTKDGVRVQESIDITISNQIKWEVWDTKHNVEVDKFWTIEFNKVLDIKTILEKNIYVTDKNGEIIPMFYYQKEQNIDKFIYITPVKDYISGEIYTLWIKDLKSKDGSTLCKNVKMDFIIK